MTGFHEVIHQLTPLLVCILVATMVGGGIYLGRTRIFAKAHPHSMKLKDRLDRAKVNVKVEDLTLGMLGATGVLWAAFSLYLHPGLLYEIIALPVLGLVVFKAFGRWVEMRIAQRINAFNNQLEMVLRMMASAIRSGLSLRQALIMVTEEMPDPARYEFNLTIKQTNIGMSMNDALARLALRMPSQELDMLTKAIAIQSQTGGNLGKTIDHLATTIKDRRKLFRKVQALTSEARASGWVLGLLPIVVAVFIMSSQAQLRSTVFDTFKGHMVLVIALAFEGAGIASIIRLLSFKV